MHRVAVEGERAARVALGEEGCAVWRLGLRRKHHTHTRTHTHTCTHAHELSQAGADKAASNRKGRF